MELCQWRLIHNSCLDIRFLARESGGLCRGIPSTTAAASVEGPNRPSKRAKLGSGEWWNVKQAIIWFARELLIPSNAPYLMKTLHGIGEEAPNIESCVVHAAPPKDADSSYHRAEVGLPVTALAAFLRGAPKIRKLDLRSLPLYGTKQDFSDMQSVLWQLCPLLEEFYFVGQQNDSGAPEILPVYAGGAKTAKRLSLGNITLSNPDSIESLETASNLEYLHLEVPMEATVFRQLSRVIKACKNLSHLSMRILPGTTKGGQSDEEALELFVKTLALQRVLVLELDIHTDLVLSPWLQPWQHMIEYNYSCTCFKMKVFGNEEEAAQQISKIQTFAKLNSNRRSRLLSYSQSDLVPPFCWVRLLQEMGASDTVLDSQEVLTGIYSLVRQQAGHVVSMALDHWPENEGTFEETATRALQGCHNKQEQKYSNCLVALADKDVATAGLWTHLATVQQEVASGGGRRNQHGRNDQVDEYAMWLDILARDHTHRAKSLQHMKEVKTDLDAQVLNLPK